MNKEDIKRQLTITQVLSHVGAVKAKGKNAFHCFRHEDKHPSLVANDERGVCTCLSSTCDLKAGSDIFEVIKLVYSCDFSEAVKIALSLLGKSGEPEPFVSFQKTKTVLVSDSETADLETIPTLYDLKDKHLTWLNDRYGKEARDWLIQRFQIRAWHFHLALPIDNQGDSYVFIPLDKEQNRTFYRGKVRSAQLFPNRTKDFRTKRKIFVCEGEKDVLRVEWELYKTGLLPEWAVITNTNGASNLKSDFPLFQAFDPSWIQEIVIAYDNDDAGQQASWTAFQLACVAFPSATKIRVLDFPAGSPKGYDVSDYLKDGNLLFR